mgnify:CR=1 FL=1
MGLVIKCNNIIELKDLDENGTEEPLIKNNANVIESEQRFLNKEVKKWN